MANTSAYRWLKIVFRNDAENVDFTSLRQTVGFPKNFQLTFHIRKKGTIMSSSVPHNSEIYETMENIVRYNTADNSAIISLAR